MSYEGNGLFQVKKGKKISYITADGRVAFPDREEGPSFYREKGKYGILDDRGNRVTAPLYREVLAPFSEGIETLLEELRRIDPIAAEKLHLRDEKRIMDPVLVILLNVPVNKTYLFLSTF